MKKISALLIAFTNILILSNAYALFENTDTAQTLKSLTLINNFDKTLKFDSLINPNVFADFPSSFSLTKGQNRTTRIKSKNDLEGYIGANGPQKENAYFGVDGRMVHGYISRKVAYSWTDPDKFGNAKIIFCTPEVYAQENHC